jgi:hypothetical protein
MFSERDKDSIKKPTKHYLKKRVWEGEGALEI